MTFPDSFLADLRARLSVSDVARKFMTLKRAGNEWKATSPWNTKERTPSFTVVDGKEFWHDFSANKNGTIFDLEMEFGKCDFPEAVKRLAKMAGMTVPGEDSKPNGSGKPYRNGHTQSVPPPIDDDDPGPQPQPSTNGKDHGHPNGTGGGEKIGQQRLVAIYAYRDADGGLRYEKCKFEWYAQGKRKKTFRKRRHAPGEPGVFIWGLEGGEYVRPHFTRDWYTASKAQDWWRITARKTFEDEPVGLYGFTELREEVAESPGERRTIFLPEGEQDVETLKAWGLVAITPDGHSLEPHYAAFLDECDVVIPVDNDRAGRTYAHQKASQLRGIAKRVRLLDWRDHWPGCREGADITDWCRDGGGTRDQLLALLDKLPDWRPEPPESSFGAVPWFDLDRPANELEWLVKKIATRREVSIWWGQPGSGKSFLVLDLGMAIARGVPWFGQRVRRQGLVVYQAGEGGLGLKKRMRAYLQHHGLDEPRKSNFPFVLLSSRINLYAAEDDTTNMIKEIKAWRDYYDAPLDLVVIDTYAAAAIGANENASEDVGRVLQRCHKIATETGAHVALVHHTPKGGGSPRGWGGFSGNVETSIEVLETSDTVSRRLADGSHRQWRRKEFWIRKQKDDESGICWPFILRQVKLGMDQDGDPKTSCVIEAVTDEGASSRTDSTVIPPGYDILPPNSMKLLRALDTVLKTRGIKPPAGEIAAQVPSYAERVVRVQDWRDELVRVEWPPGDDDPEGRRLRMRAKHAIAKTYTDKGWDDPKRANLIGKFGEYVWRTPKLVHMLDDPPPATAWRARNEPQMSEEPPPMPQEHVDAFDDEMNRPF